MTYRILSDGKFFILQKSLLNIFWLTQQFDLPVQYTYFESIKEIILYLRRDHRYIMFDYYTIFRFYDKEQFKDYYYFDTIETLINQCAEELL